MKLYINNSTDPFFNLAAEEYLITHAEDDIAMLWRNAPAVIIGKNQNAFAEINFDFVREHGIKVVRRMTGGGAVFHDLGNVNYTFISVPGGRLGEGIREGGIDFAYFTKPIIDALSELSLNASLSGRNDIVVNTADGERKVSGNAQCVINSATLHHGTLLFSAQMEKLSGALNVDSAKLKSKGVASVRSRVANMRDLMSVDARKKVDSVTDFMAFLSDKLSAGFGIEVESLPADVCNGIQALAAEKYSTDGWNLRRFGNFSTVFKERFAYGTVEARFSVTEGRISEIEFGGDFFGELDVSELAEKMVGTGYMREALTERLSELDVGRYILGATASEIANLLLSVERVL